MTIFQLMLYSCVMTMYPMTGDLLSKTCNWQPRGWYLSEQKCSDDGRTMKCPQWADAIMNLGPITKEEKSTVAADFKARMQREYATLDELKKWQHDHPQCKRVEWWITGGTSINGGPWSASTYSVEDFSGHFKGKPGQCSADGRGQAWRGTEEDLKSYDPTTNPLIAQVACADALHKINLGDGWYADPNLCDSPQ